MKRMSRTLIAINIGAVIAIFVALMFSVADAAPITAFECGVVDYKPDNRNYARQITANLNVGEPRTVRLIYFLPNDRPYRADVVQRMKDEILNIQSFYAEAMQAHGYDMTFKIETDTQDHPVIHRVDGQHADLHYIDDTSFTVRAEVKEIFDVKRNIYLIVTDNKFDRIGRGVGKIRANADATRYGKNGGTALIPAYQFQRRIRYDNLGYIQSGYDKLSSHELGHTFGLSHDFRSGGYVMSYGAGLNRAPIDGPDQDSLSKCNADCLSVHPYFNLNIPTESGVPPTIELTSPDTYPAGADSVQIEVKSTDSEGIHQVILFVQSVGAFSPVGFPEVKAYHKLMGEKEATVNFEYDGDVPGSSFTKLSRYPQHNIHIAAIDINGDISNSTFTFSEESTGQVDNSKEGLKVLGGKHEVGNNNSYQTLNLPTRARFRIGKGGTGRNNRTAAFSPNGQYLAVASSIGIWLYDTVSYQEVSLLDSQYPIDCIAFSPDGEAIVGGSRHGRIQNQVWDIITKEKIADFSSAGTLNSVAFLPNGNTIAFAAGKSLILWDVETEQEIMRIRSDELARDMSISHDGNMIASGHWSGIINVWDTNTGTLTNTFRHNAYIKHIAFSPTENILASSSGDSTMKLWNTVTGTENFTINGYSNALTFSHDGQTLAWEDEAGINLWDIATQSFVAIYKRHDPFSIDTINFSPDRQRFVTVNSIYDSVKVWDIQTGNTIDLGHFGIKSILFSPDSTIFASSGYNRVKLWDVNTGENVDNIPNYPKSLIKHIAFIPNSNTIAYRVSREKFTRLWDITVKKQIGVIQNPTFNNNNSWEFSPDGKILASAEGRLITLWNVETKGKTSTLEGHLDTVYNVTFSPDGNTIASTSIGINSSLRLWDVNTTQNIKTFEVQPEDNESFIGAVAFSPDGKVLVSSQLNVGVKVWNLTTQSMTTITSEDRFLAFLPDSSIMLLRSYYYKHGEQVSAWDAKTATYITTLAPTIFEHWKTIMCSPDGETLAIAGQDSVTLFDPKVIYNQLPPAAPESVNTTHVLQTQLLNNYPNPFNPETWIPYRLAEDANVELTIYDTRGHVVRRIDIGHKKSGVYETRNNAIYWDGSNDLGERVASGVYFYHLKAGDYSATKRMLILK